MFKYLPLFFFISHAFALVDYGETSKIEAARITTGKSWYKGASMGVGYETIKTKDLEFNLVKVGMKYQTDFNLYVDTSFWAGKVGGDTFGPGNLQLALGYGLSGVGNATLDLVAGVNFSTWDSHYASGRVDQIYSLFSTKRFSSFIFGLGTQWRVTSDSKLEEVTSIGNIGTYFVMLGLEISKDINIFIEGGLVSIAPGKANGSGNYLKQKMKYTYLSPLLQLGIFSQLWVELGAAFKINDEGYDDSLAGARLFDLKGIYGNSLFTEIKYAL